MYAGRLNYQEFGSRSPTGIGNSSGSIPRLINFGKPGKTKGWSWKSRRIFFAENREQEMIREILNRPSLYKLTPKVQASTGFPRRRIFPVDFLIFVSRIRNRCLINNRTFSFANILISNRSLIVNWMKF